MNQYGQIFPADDRNSRNNLFFDLLKIRAKSLKQSLAYPVERLIFKKSQHPELTDSIISPSDSPAKSVEEEIRDESAKNQAVKKESDKQIVDDLVKKSNRVI